MKDILVGIDYIISFTRFRYFTIVVFLLWDKLASTCYSIRHMARLDADNVKCGRNNLLRYSEDIHEYKMKKKLNINMKGF